jgi:hypothetical protein
MVTDTLEGADIQIERLFLNADAGFHSTSFRASSNEKEIHANVCFNKRNENT